MKKEFNYFFYDLNIKNDVLKDRIEDLRKDYEALEKEIYLSFSEGKISDEEKSIILEKMRNNKNL